MSTPLREVVADALPELPLPFAYLSAKPGQGFTYAANSTYFQSLLERARSGKPYWPKDATLLYTADQVRELLRATTPAASEGVGERARFVVEAIHCNCHPETCCCADARLRMDGESISSGSFESMQRIADNLAAALRAPAASVGGGGRVVGYVRRDASQARMTVNLPEGTPLYTTQQEARAVDGQEEDAYVIERMGRLLAEISVIVNGPHPANGLWSYHDLPAKVESLRAALLKIAAWGGEWGPYPETKDAWREMTIVTAREAVPHTIYIAALTAAQQASP